MQDMEPAKRRGRSKSFFGSENETAGNMENSTEKSAPNLNGENADETEKNLKDDEVKNKLGGKGAEIDEPSKARKGKKRKASELKSEDENANEETLKAKDDAPTQSEAPVVDDGESKVTDVLESKESENKTDKESESELMDDMTMPQKQTLGKGKRARIPNKKYSDILISPLNKNKTAENGSERIESENDSLVEVSLKDEPTVQASPVIKKQKISVDLTDPKFLKPFKYGWKRELVWRATNDVGGKRNGDIYYYTPTGKKMRSMREVAENLKSKELTLENFTFFKDSLGVDDPEKELIRDAKIKSSSTPVAVSKKVATPKIAKIPKSPKLPASPKVPAKTPTKVLSPKIASPKVDSNESADTTNAKSKPTKTIGNFKIKLPLKKDTKKSSKDEEEMQTDTPTKPATSRRSGKWSKQTPNSASKAKKRTLKVANEAKEDLKSQDFLQNLSFGYNTLLYVFQYLKVQDLLRAGCVCTMWRDVASHPLLWRTVRMKNSQVHSFEGLANTLKKHGTRHLDLRKMLLPPSGDDLWLEFSKVIKKVDTLRRIELCRCPAVVVEKLAVSNPHLEVVNAVTIRCEHMNLEPFKAMTNLKELRIKSTSGLNLNADLDSLKELKQLKHLSLTSIRDLDKMNLSVIAELTNLESLDLGECSDFPETFGSDILIKLEKLEKLRLEKGQGNCHTFEILEAVKDMKQLEQLELVNFDIKSGFDKALGGCQNIKKLLIIPTYISQSATTNHMVLGGVLRLQKTLSHFVWGVTLELLRVTELFVDQCEEPKKEKKPVGNGDSIPVLKPVPLLIDRDSTEIPPAHDPPQVEILALPSLQKLLMQNLPSTRVKILKIPFHATWRQSITDSVN